MVQLFGETSKFVANIKSWTPLDSNSDIMIGQAAALEKMKPEKFLIWEMSQSA